MINEFPIELTDAEAEKLVNIIKRGSMRSGILVMKSLAASFTFRDKVKDMKKLDKYLGL